MLASIGKVKSSAEPGFPWLYTAVDLITQCLMFMVLIVTFGTEIFAAAKPTPPPPKDAPKRGKQQDIERLLADSGAMKSVKLMREGANLTLVLGEAIFFASGQAVLRSAAVGVVRRLGAVVARGDYQVWVEGYTDDVPIHSARFPSNWELSAARAIAVVAVLQDSGVSPSRLAAAGYGEFHPRFPNDSSANRAGNRRVEIRLVLER